MSALGTLVATAAISIGVAKVVKTLRRRRANRQTVRDENPGGTIDMTVDHGSGVWRDPKSRSQAN